MGKTKGAESGSPATEREAYSYEQSWLLLRWWSQFLWWCAGADQQLLERCPHHERVKYEGLGGVVLATAVLAFMSSSYAFYTVFLPKSDLALAPIQQDFNSTTAGFAVAFGIIWALVIFNLDRFVVSSAGKGDGKESVSLGELVTAFPRLILAVAIAVTISKPLEIRVMESEIEAQLELEQQQYRGELDAEAEQRVANRKTEILAKIDEAMTRLDERRSYFEKRRVEIQEQRRLLEQEIEGTVGSGKRGRGPATLAKEENLERMEAELERDRIADATRIELLEGERDRYKTELASLDASLAQSKEWNARQANNLDGLVKRIEVAHQINPLIGYALMLLFVMIEIAPILFKLMLVRGAYDYLEIDAQLHAALRQQVKLKTAGEGLEIASADYLGYQNRTLEEEKRLTEERRLRIEELERRARELREQLAATPAPPAPAPAPPVPVTAPPIDPSEATTLRLPAEEDNLTPPPLPGRDRGASS